MLSTNIFLIGPMGAGKTTIGKMLASELGTPFLDSDHMIEERSGADIPWIFDVEGEKGFRDRESQVVEELCGRQGIVLATGGGAVEREVNRSFLRKSGFVVYLRTPVSVQLQRTKNDKKRPLLHRPDREEFLTKLLNEREPLYQSIADLVLDTDRLSLRQVIRKIIQTTGLSTR
ncbi:MAG: shikimate kinase AroK [Endozoicomonas sp.]